MRIRLIEKYKRYNNFLLYCLLRVGDGWFCNAMGINRDVSHSLAITGGIYGKYLVVAFDIF